MIRSRSIDRENAVTGGSPRFHRLLFCVTLVVALCQATPVRSQELTTPQLLEQKAQWKQWVSDQHKIQLTGRYKGRAADRLQLQKLNISFVPEQGITIPSRVVRPGTRVSISGYFVKDGRRPEFRMTRLAIESSDYERMLEELLKLPEDQSAARYELADRYQAVATFFEDPQLHAEVDRCRLVTFAAQREKFSQNPDALWKLVDPGPGFTVDEGIRQHIRFEVLALKGEQRIDAELRGAIGEHLPGWNKVNPEVPPELQAAFAADRRAAYGEAEDAERRQLERLLYRDLRLKELRGTIRADDSNALQVSLTVAKELPEEQEAVREMESAWADYRLQNIEKLRRRDLDEVVALLRRIDREEDGAGSVDKWLAAQEERFRREGYQGQSRLADEFLHAWMRWKKVSHRDQGIEYLKRAWDLASSDAPEAVAEFEQRLKNLGFTRLHERWMTDEEVKSLPKDDTELALKEGRVVEGMLLPQVRAIMGAPTRRMRLVSTQHVEEVWVYGERHASRIVFRLRRQISQPEESATVIERMQVVGI